MAKKILSVQDMFVHATQKKFTTWLDRLHFVHILLLWSGILIMFGFLYYLLKSTSSFLLYSANQKPVVGLFDHIYFSFISATSTGFGDIIPVGGYKVIAIVEVIFGLVLLAFVTSKLVSIKQDIILSEIYEISFHEKINRVRSSLLLFRQNISRIIERVEDKSISHREISDLFTHIAPLEDVLNEILVLMHRDGNNHFTKAMDPLDTELIYNSVIHSFEKLKELIIHLHENEADWRRESTISHIEKCLSLNRALFEVLKPAGNLKEKAVADLNNQNEKIIEMVKKDLGKEKV